MRRPSLLGYALLAAGGALLALLAWAAASPEGVPGFFWRHFAGPVASQAAGEPVTWDGIRAVPSYTLPSLLGYGALLVAGLALVDALLLKRLGLRLDWGFAVALAPFFVLGPLLRALQVTGLFTGPGGEPTALAYAAVEPTVYLTTALLAGLALAWGGHVARRGWTPRQRLVASALVLLAAGAAVHALLAFGDGPHPPSLLAFTLLMVPLALAAGEAAARVLRAPHAGPALAVGLVLLAPFLGAALLWVLQPGGAPPWPGPGAGPGPAWVMPVVLLAALAMALLVTALLRLSARAWPRARDAASAAAALLLFAHAVDGLSTVVGVKDPFGWGLPQYHEQNPVSLALLGVWNGWGFLLAKIALAVGVAFLLTDYARKDSDTPEGEGAFEELLPLAYIAVFALGWGPGFTNLLRAAFGV